MSTPDEVLAAALCTLPNTCIEHHHDAELAIAALAAQFVIVPRDATQTDGGPAQPGARPAVTTPPSVANPDEGFAIVRSDELAGLRAALTTIRDKYGKVCEDYEVCVHDACASSYGAWATADAALEGVSR